MGSGIFATIGDQRVELSAKQVKAEIMKIRGWSSEQYQKEYDILRNKLRTYESFMRSSGANVQPQSPAAFLYTESKAMKRYGANYTSAARTRAIRSTQSISSGKKLQQAVTGSGTSARAAFERVATTELQAFSRLIEINPTAAKMAAAIKDPVKLLNALKEFAKELHMKMTREGELDESAAIPFGQTFGSDDVLDFDYTAWLN